MTVACARCGQVWDSGAARPECLAVPGRRCTAGDGQVATAAQAAEVALAGVVPAGVDVDESTLQERLDAAEAAVLEPDPALVAGSELADFGDDEEATESFSAPGAGDPGDTPGDTDADTDDTPGLPEQPRRANGQFGAAGGTGSAKFAQPGQVARAYDWEAARKRYVEGVKTGETVYWPTLTEVGEHFGYPPSRVRERSAAQGWRSQRTQWQAQVEATRRQARSAALAKEGVNLDNDALKAARLGLQLAFAKMGEIGSAHTAARQAAGPGALTGAIDALEQTRLAQAVDLWHKIGLRAIGDPETHRLELTGPGGERLEIAQELRRDDPSRIAGVLGVLQQAGLGDLFGGDGAAAERTIEARRGSDGTYSTDEARD